MTSLDPLAEFRGSPATVRPVTSTAGPAVACYRAFRAGERPRAMLWIRVNQSNRSSDVAPSYGYLQMVVSDGAGFLIGLCYAGFLSVRIRGRNLQPLFEQLIAHNVEWLEEFEPKNWTHPGAGEAVITAIEIQMAGIEGHLQKID